MKRTIILILFIQFGVVATGNAAALGMAKTTVNIGYGMGFSRLQVDDPDGDTETAVAFQPIRLIFSDWTESGNRIWLETYFQNTELRASETLIGQYVEHAGMRFQVQRNFALHRHFKPWFGVGLDISVSRYIRRHTMDDEGFLLQDFGSRSNNASGVVLSAMNQWRVNSEWDVGARIEQLIATQNAIDETSLSMFFLFKF